MQYRGLCLVFLAVCALHAETVTREVEVWISKEHAIGALKPGAVVSVIYTKGDWTKVRYENAHVYFEGFVQSNVLVKETDNGLPDVKIKFDFVATAPAPVAPAHGVEPAPERKPTGKDLKMGGFWNRAAMSRGKIAIKDVQTVLASHGEAKAELKNLPSIPIYKNITLMMPLNDVSQKLGAQPKFNRKVTLSGLPVNSFKYHVYDVSLDGCSQVCVVTDLADQTVALQLVDERPRTTRIYGHTSEYHVYNFIQAKSRATTSSQIAHNASMVDDVLILESELVEGYHKCNEYIKLFMPKPILDLIAYSNK